jgi:hypothetical protein
MRITRSRLLMSGVVAGGAFILSCGDNLGVTTITTIADASVDGSMPVDAAPACDCPAAEPPLAGRLVVVSNDRTIPANDKGIEGVGCPPGARLITGNCTTNNPTVIFNVTVREAGYYYGSPPSSWHCNFRNNEPTPVTFRASALCLKPTP